MAEFFVQIMKFNPFKPGNIIGTNMFAGRYNEINQLARILFQTKNGNSQNFIIHGERGIGKSSLMLFIRDLASGKIEIPGLPKFNYLTMNVEYNSIDTYLSIVLKISRELNRVLINKHDIYEGVKVFWEFLRKWEVLGVKYQENKERIDGEVFEDCVNSISETLKRLNDSIDGLIIFIDEADKPSISADVGAFLKNFVERLTIVGCNKVIVGVSGLSSLLSKMKESHESSLRNFTIMHLEPLLVTEVDEVVTKAINYANEKNRNKMEIDNGALSAIKFLSEGYPHFIQQFGYSAFEKDDDWMIDSGDVFDGAIEENGAFHQLGTKYFSGIYFDKIGSDEYRSVLNAMATKGDDWITKDEIRELAGVKETSLTNAIATLKKRNVIIPKDGVKGVYRLPSRSFSVWIKHFATAKKEEKS